MSTDSFIRVSRVSDDFAATLHSNVLLFEAIEASLQQPYAHVRCCKVETISSASANLLSHATVHRHHRRPRLLEQVSGLPAVDSE